MKKCTYCGKEYPDEATACAVDQQPLVSLTPDKQTPAGPCKTKGVSFNVAFHVCGVICAVIAFLFVSKEGGLAWTLGKLTAFYVVGGGFFGNIVATVTRDENKPSDN